MKRDGPGYGCGPELLSHATQCSGAQHTHTHEKKANSTQYSHDCRDINRDRVEACVL